MPRSPILLFDLDGTITDSLPGIAACLHHALAEIGMTWDTRRDIREIAGPPMPATLRSLGVDGEPLATAMRAYRRRYDDIGWSENSVFPGMAELLGRLHTDGYRMAVATSKAETSARRILEHFGLAPLFEFIGGADPDSGRAEKSEVIGHTLAALGRNGRVPGSGAAGAPLMVGDRIHDVEGAERHGIPCCLVEWGYGPEQERHLARWVARDPDELEEIIHEQ